MEFFCQYCLCDGLFFDCRPTGLASLYIWICFSLPGPSMLAASCWTLMQCKMPPAHPIVQPSSHFLRAEVMESVRFHPTNPAPESLCNFSFDP
jgi:hypothetical protein